MIESNSTISLNQWHTVVIKRIGRTAALTLDNDPPVSVVSKWLAEALDVKSHFYVGGVPMLTYINPNAVGDKSLKDFTGCIDTFEVRNYIVANFYFGFQCFP